MSDDFVEIYGDLFKGNVSLFSFLLYYRIMVNSRYN